MGIVDAVADDIMPTASRVAEQTGFRGSNILVVLLFRMA
jgi:hypothetical protein